MTKCKYEYKHAEKKKCPHEALDGKDICYWHEERTDKNPFEEIGTKDLRNLDLVEANLQGAHLMGAHLQGAHLAFSNLQEANLLGANLQRANLWRANLQRAYLIGANLQRASLEGANLHGTDLHEAKFDDSSLWRAELDEIVIGEMFGDKEKDIETKLMEFEEASEIYHNLKNYFRNEGIYERSGNYYYREKVVERKIYKQKNKGKYLGSLLLDLLCGYGEKPGRIIISSLSWIFLNSIMYFILGIEKGVVEVGLSLQAGFCENAINFLDCLYFSFVTFTTLGYGDLHPVAITKAFAAVEAFTGAFMLALFVLTMGRKMMR